MWNVTLFNLIVNPNPDPAFESDASPVPDFANAFDSNLGAILDFDPVVVRCGARSAARRSEVPRQAKDSSQTRIILLSVPFIIWNGTRTSTRDSPPACPYSFPPLAKRAPPPP
ncbi:hypothetical protein EVAR_10047_1 [Eumeta japonica]|uniref:Uncharacterized protein n=1 Tax=Eumeta variegata TaxID=151549 RepID=A0A4C1TRD0_EUMVA|nr:hypothetical protein EVAR_10047_1 [Eumeta japonica]